MRYLGFVLVLASGALMASPTAGDTDAIRVAPQVYKVVLENERVRVLSFVTEPGQTWPLHSHPDSVAISISEYSVRNIIPGQAPTERHSKPGDVRWISATSHIGQNSGTTEMRGVIVELKEPRP
jgi:beta-alanine degradation protein BauB